MDLIRSAFAVSRSNNLISREIRAEGGSGGRETSSPYSFSGCAGLRAAIRTVLRVALSQYRTDSHTWMAVLVSKQLIINSPRRIPPAQLELEFTWFFST